MLSSVKMTILTRCRILPQQTAYVENLQVFIRLADVSVKGFLAIHELFTVEVFFFFKF